MKNKKPINIFNGLKTKVNTEIQHIQQQKTNLVSINSYQNPRNITKPFVKPISKII